MNLHWITPTDFRHSRGEVGHHVWIAIQRGVHPVDVLGIVGKVNTDKRGVAVPGNDTVKGVYQIRARRINIGITEPPAFVILQFLPAFVFLQETVQRGPRSLNRYAAELTRRLFPDRPRQRWYKKWWIWTAVAAAVGASVGVTWWAATRNGQEPDPNVVRLGDL